MRKIGYCRFSSTQQNLDRQLGALRAEGVDVLYREKASGKSVKNRPELERAIDALGTGDILVVAEWDRATRSTFDGIEIIKRINDRGALIKVLDKPHLDLTTPLGRGFIAFLSAMAEDERPHPQEGQRRPCRGQGQGHQVRPQAQAHRAPAVRSPQASGRRRKLPIDRQDDGRAPRYGREAGWVGAARV